jgi:hypothetical protein
LQSTPTRQIPARIDVSQGTISDPGVVAIVLLSGLSALFARRGNRLILRRKHRRVFETRRFSPSHRNVKYQMYSREHLAMSIVVGAALVPLVETPLGPAGTVVFAGLVGTGVDLDHFVIARVRTGTWTPLRRAVSSPRLALIHQEELFEPGDVGTWERIASHLVIAIVLVGGLLPTAPSLGVVTAAVLGSHIAADILWDAWRARRELGPETTVDRSQTVRE